MSDRESRYFAAVCLAQMILEQPPADDDRLIAEAIAALTAEIHAGRQEQKAFPVISAEQFEQLSNGPTPRLRVVDSAGFNVRVPDKEAS